MVSTEGECKVMDLQRTEKQARMCPTATKLQDPP